MRKFCMLFIVLSLSLVVTGQSIFSNTITGTNPNTFNPYTDGQVLDPGISSIGIARGAGLNGSNANNRYNASGWNTTSLDANDYFEFTISPDNGLSIDFTSFEFTGQASASGPIEYSFRSSLDNFSTEIAAILATGSVVDLSNAQFQDIQTTISFRIYAWGSSSTSGTFSVNDFSFNGLVEPVVTGPSPVIAINSSILPFQMVAGSGSGLQSYSVTGTDLSGNISVSATTGFEVSLSSTSGFNSNIGLVHTSGTVNATIYLRSIINQPGLVQGQIIHSSNGALNQVLEVSAQVLAAEPGAPSSILVNGISPHSIDLVLSGGGGEGRIIIMKQGSAVTAVPVDGVSYTGSLAFGSGQAILPGEYVVYSGYNNIVNVTGLSPNTNYHISVFEFNDAGISSAVNYASQAGNANHTTQSPVSGFKLSALHVPFIIDFDHSSFDANVSQFNGNGFSNEPSAGQLHSGAWSVKGWTDGDLTFLGTRTSGDYARGFTLSHPTTGGIYSFEPSAPGNRALGFQPGSGDWSPGSITLRILNQSGFTLNNLAVSYKLYVFNNADRSSSFNFSYSIDDINYLPVNDLDFVSVELAGSSPTWNLNKKNTELEDISIAPGQYVYLRWSSADVSGSGSRDEFALDDITITGNPIANGPLPVRFTTIQAYKEQNGVVVRFGNATEENISEYLVERSANGNGFSSFSRVLPLGNNGEGFQYEVMDSLPLKGDNYYRISSVETNGQVTHSTIVRVNTEDLITALIVFPNPLQGNEIGIRTTELPAGRYEIKIFDILGRLVKGRSVKHTGGAIIQNLTVSHLPPGWYGVQINGDTKLRSQFIKK